MFYRPSEIATRLRPTSSRCNSPFCMIATDGACGLAPRLNDGASAHRYKPVISFSRRASMASHKSAEKRIRQTAKRTAINRARISRVRTFVKKVETAIASRDKDAARSAFQLAQPELHRAITKGLLHQNTVSRKLSRLATRINAL